ncbi:MAG: T9SS type A sorting domain-containing protein [Bacteroidales bacterium]|nr:T9SS type A sorting domain-containing protein [Bacteroidales bacterium]
MKKLFTLAFMLLMFVGFAQDPGTLDETYGNGGTVDFNPTDYRDLQATIHAQKDGKILIVSKSSIEGADYYICVTRQNPDGSIDETYGENGYAFFKYMTAAINEPFASVLTDDNYLYIAGHIYADGVMNKSYILCVDENGFADVNFGDNGYALSSLNEPRALAMDSQGNLYIGGCVYYANNTQFDVAMVERFTPEGELDLSYADNGKMWLTLEETSNYIYALDVDENDRLITGGNALFKKEGYYWGVPTPQLCRVNPDGSLDNTFGDNGSIFLGVSEGNAAVYSVDVQSDGKYLVLGYLDRSDVENDIFSTGTYIARVTTDGEIDTSFGDNGLTILEILKGDQCHNYSREFVVAHDDQIFGTLYTQDLENNNYRVYAYNLNADGTLNEEFLTGVVPLPWSDVEVLSLDVDMQRDGKLLVVGYRYDGTPDYRLLTSRLHTTVAPLNDDVETGTSEIAIEVEVLSPTSVKLTFTPNEYTTEYFYGVLPKDQYEQYGEEFCADYFYDYGMPTEGAVEGTMDVEADTDYIVMAFGYNAEGERGTITTKDFSTIGCIELNDIQFIVYPNPATSMIYVEMENDKDTQVSILDVTGRCVKSAELKGNVSSINIEDVEKGVYFIMIQQGENNSVRKLVVK